MFPSIKIYDKNCIKYIAIVKIMIKKKQKKKMKFKLKYKPISKL